MANNNQIEKPTPREISDNTPDDSSKDLAKPEEQQSGSLGIPSDEEIAAQLAYETLAKNKKAKRRKRIITIAVLLALVIGAIAFFVVGGKSEDPMKAMAKSAFQNPVLVRKGEFEATVGGSGKAAPVSESVVSPEVAGIIENLTVVQGQEVKEGDPLFTLKNDKLDTAVRDAQEKLSTAERARDRAQEKVDKAYRNINEADAEAQRAWDAANASGEWDNYNESALRTTIRTAEDARDEAEHAREDADTELEKARTALEEAQKEADKRVIKAPVSGSVVAVNAKNGQSVGGAAGGTSESGASSNAPLVQIADTSQMKVAVQINEVDIEQVAVGQTARVLFQAFNDFAIEASVQSIATVATGTSSSSSGSDAAGGVVTYEVDLVVPNKDNQIKPGMTATISIVTKSLDDAIIAPASAVFGVDLGDPYVLKITDAENQAYEKVPVKVVEESATEIALDGDIAEGDMLLGMDLDMMADGSELGE